MWKNRCASQHRITTEVEDLFVSDYMKNGKLGMIITGSWVPGNWEKEEPMNGRRLWTPGRLPRFLHMTVAVTVQHDVRRLDLAIPRMPIISGGEDF